MFVEVHQLKEAGFKRSEVARRLNLNWKTVNKYWTMEPDGFAEATNKASNRTRKLDKYEDDIIKWLKKFPDMTAAQVEDWLKEHYDDTEIKGRTVRSYVAYLRDKHGIPKQPSEGRQYEAVPDPPMGHQLQLDFGGRKRYKPSPEAGKSFMHSAVYYRILAKSMGGVVRHSASDEFPHRDAGKLLLLLRRRTARDRNRSRYAHGRKRKLW